MANKKRIQTSLLADAWSRREEFVLWVWHHYWLTPCSSWSRESHDRFQRGSLLADLWIRFEIIHPTPSSEKELIMKRKERLKQNQISSAERSCYTQIRAAKSCAEYCKQLTVLSILGRSTWIHGSLRLRPELAQQWFQLRECSSCSVLRFSPQPLPGIYNHISLIIM